MFSDNVTAALVSAAKAHGIDPATLCALIEVETGGAMFEQDGRTPRLLYERHVAYREAAKVSNTVLAAFVRAGLAVPKWNRATQYRDQRTSAQRLDLLARARAIDEETALRSCSWGLGQTMGFLAPALGFASAREMVGHQGTIDGQIDCVVRELRRSHLIEPLNDLDWHHVARLYNGPGYQANRYHLRLADAFKRWARRLDVEVAATDPGLSVDAVRAVQRRLRDLGYAEVGATDGLWGPRTIGAISAFQAHEGLSVTGRHDDATRVAMASAEPRPVAVERAEAGCSDLKNSRTLKQAGQITIGGRVMKWLGFGGAGAAGADQAGWLDDLAKSVDEIDTLRGLAATLFDLAAWAAAHWWLFAIAGGLFIASRADRIVAARLDDHRTGVHAG